MELYLITICDGDIKGQIKKDIRGNSFYSFEGIPYGQPPIGKLRFKAPQPVKPWKGTKNALSKGQFNVQLNLAAWMNQNAYDIENIDNLLKGSEDCLNLNVYTRSISKRATLKPVMFWLFGGAFVMGSSNKYGPEFLMTEDVVLVTINYRLGALGFLALEEQKLNVCNAGLKDMILALNWVQKNIRCFNGDPNNVTLFGQSAGAVSAHCLILQPSNKGLFHKAILQSGTSLLPGQYGAKRDGGKVLAQHLGFTGTSDEEILEYLQNQPVQNIYKAQVEIGRFLDSSNLNYFSITKEEGFLPEKPVDVLRSGKYNHIPILTGFTAMEGLHFLSVPPEFPGFKVRSIEDEYLPPEQLRLERGSKKFWDAARSISKFYFGDNDKRDRLSREAILLTGDNFIVRAVYECAKLHSLTSKQPVYLYRMTVKSKLVTHTFPKGIEEPTHGDDINYLFKTRFTPDITPGSLEDISQRRFTKLWTNFAKFGHPTNSLTKDELIPIDWPAVKNGVMNFLDIGTELTVGVNPEAERMAFWEDFFHTYTLASKY